MIKVHFYLDFVLFFPDMVYDSLIKAAVGNFGVNINNFFVSYLEKMS